MRYLLLICLSFSITFSNSILQKAKIHEEKGEYLQAMKLYKELALEKNTFRYKEINNKDSEGIKKEEDSHHFSINKSDNKLTSSTLEQMLESKFDLHTYKENYFMPFSYVKQSLQGRESTEAKFQISIKKPIAENILGLNETINFAYTQTSWWQLYSDSAPFRETNYKPEVFVLAPYESEEDSAFKAYKFGFLHESNGQASELSRSWNRLYLSAYFQLGDLFLSPRIWYRLSEDEENDNNPDIQDYLGYGDLNLLYIYEKHTFKLLLRNNLKKDNKGFAELNWMFPLFNSNNTFAYVQVSNGYGDSLIDYDENISRFSFGISLSR